MKRCVIVHCWEGYPEYCWYPWVKSELEKKGFEVLVPEMPNTKNPILIEWLTKLKETIKKADGDLYLVGHSLGCIAILRYLESLEEDVKIAGVIMVAGFTDNLGFKEIESFFIEPLDFKKIKSHSNKFVAIHSDNDPYVSLKFGDIFKEKLNAKVIIKNNMKHFSGPIENEESCTELPIVIESILG
jgi:uncharacterized protein